MTTAGSAGPTAIDWENLISAGRDLLPPRTNGAPPTGEHIRRAISNAYYAMFHALAHSNADALVGAPRDAVTAATWLRVYRGLDHGTARRELQRHRRELSPEARAFADAFQDLQNRRHSADYNPGATFTVQQASVWLTEAQAAISDYLQTDRSERAYVAAVTLIRPR